MHSTVKDFIDRNYRHFNANTLKQASKAYAAHIDNGGKMLVTLAGAMSTAELGISLAEMIREGKVHGVCCTGANLEEDIFNAVAHEHYVKIPDYRSLTREQEMELYEKGLNRVTDTCIPEDEAMRKIEKPLKALWKKASDTGERYFPHEFVFQLLDDKDFIGEFQIDKRNSWVLAAKENNVPIFTPGWEDSTLGNFFVAACKKKEVSSLLTIRSGAELMDTFSEWYLAHCSSSIGFFQIGGGIAGDFPICAVPMLKQDMKMDVPYWGYFCQISDSTTSYGSYSGAWPSEKITWGKLDIDTPMYIVESDATIVAPLMFSYVLAS